MFNLNFNLKITNKIFNLKAFSNQQFYNNFEPKYYFSNTKGRIIANNKHRITKCNKQ